MTSTARIAALRYALIATGAIFAFGLYPLMQLWPSGWSWEVGPSHSPMMIVGVYATLGIFLIAAARDPLANRSLIWFTIVSTAAHAVVMAAQALLDPAQASHLVGDVPAMALVAIALWVLTTRAFAITARTDRAIRRAA